MHVVILMMLFSFDKIFSTNFLSNQQQYKLQKYIYNFHMYKLHGSLTGIHGPTFHATCIDLCIVLKCKLNIYCIEEINLKNIKY